LPAKNTTSGRKGKIPYLPAGKKTGRKALYIGVATSTLTHVCRIGLIALPYPKQMHQRQHSPICK